MKTTNNDILVKLLKYFGPSAQYEFEEYPLSEDEENTTYTYFHKIIVDKEIIICDSSTNRSINKLISNLKSNFTFIKEELKGYMDLYKAKTSLTDETIYKLEHFPEFNSKEELLMQLTLLGY